MEKNLNNQTPPPAPASDASQANTTVIPEKPKRHIPWPKILAAGIVALITLFALGLIAYLMMGQIKSEEPNQITETQITEPTPTPDPTEGDLITETEENVMTYYSPSLGITFNFIKSENGKDLYLNRNLNRVCITYDDPNDFNCNKGQFVEVYEKVSNETLTEAIERQFLDGYDEKDCYVDQVYSNIIINYPDSENPEVDPWENAKKCPNGYSRTNGLRYFYEDENYPNKYAFFSIGQYVIPAGPTINDGPWQSTFKFTDENNSISNAPTPTEEFSNWGKYNDANYPFNIKYPDSWELRTTYGKSVNNLNNDRIAGIDITSARTYGSTVIINIIDPEENSFNEWVKKYSGFGFSMPDKPNSTYNGIAAYKYEGEGSGGRKNTVIIYPFKDKFIYLEWHNFEYDQDIADKIMSTLEFN